MTKPQTPAERIAERIEGQIAGDTALEYGPHEECTALNLPPAKPEVEE